MTIGMILDAPFPPDPRVENEAVSLVQAGYQVCLFCLTYGDEPAEEIHEGIRICRYRTDKLEYKLSALAYTVPFYTRLMAKKINRFLEKYPIDFLHIHDIRIAGAVFRANQKYNLPTVLDLHDNLPEVMKLYPHLQKFPGNFLISPKRWKQNEELFIEKATKVVTVSQEFVDEVLSRTGIDQNKIVLVPNTVRASFYKDAVYEQELLDRFDGHFVLLYLGDTHLRRGLQTAIAALPALSEQIPSILLVVVGTNTTDPVLKKQVADLGMEDFVSFEGWKNVSLFPTYIKSSSLCLSPLHRNKHHDVAYANKIFQYMSLGKPLLVSDAIAQKKLIERTQSGLVHRERDVEDFIEKTSLLAANKKLRTQMGANGKAFVETEFSWEQTSKNLVHLYDNLNR